MYWPQRPNQPQPPYRPQSPKSQKRGFKDDSKMDYSQNDDRQSKKRGTTEETEDEI